MRSEFTRSSIGLQRAVFRGVTPMPDEVYGPRLRWEFGILKGECAGEIATRVTDGVPTVINRCGELLTAVGNCEVRLGNGCDSEELVPREVTILFERSLSGNRVIRVMPMGVGSVLMRRRSARWQRRTMWCPRPRRSHHKA
jgi:hypothetical protein